MSLQEMASARALHADVLAAAMEELNASTRDRGKTVWLEAFERTLAASADRYVRRLALAALVTAAGHDGWTDARLARLTDYRHDPAALVAEAAQFILPPIDLPS